MKLRESLAQWLLGKPKTAHYQGFRSVAWSRIRDLPWFHFETIYQMLLDPTVRLGLKMRAAPLCSAEFAYKVESEDGDAKWIPGILADDPQIGKFVHRQLKRIWRYDLHKLLRAQIWGWSAGEVTMRLTDGLIEVDRILFRAARDVFPLIGDGEVQGVRFQRVVDAKGYVDLRFPKAIWHAYDPENEQPYGVSVLKGCHSPWADKWLNGGALDTRRLFAHKDAYGGVDLGYPPGTTYIDEKGEVPNRDIARELVEQIQSGGVTTRPSQRDSNGNEMWPLTRATIPSSPTHIFDYPKDLDTEILRGMEIPDDVIKSDVGGAWQGKQVPMQAFYTAADIWLAQVVEDVVTQVIEPIVELNYGRGHRFEVTTKPLAEQAMDMMQAAEQPQNESEQPSMEDGAAGEWIDYTRDGKQFRRRNPWFGKQRQRFSVESEATAAELLVGHGIAEASKLLAAGKRYLSENGHKRT